MEAEGGNNVNKNSGTVENINKKGSKVSENDINSGQNMNNSGRKKKDKKKNNEETHSNFLDLGK